MRFFIQICCQTRVITHNAAISLIADKIIKFKNGGVDEIIINKNPKRVEDVEW